MPPWPPLGPMALGEAAPGKGDGCPQTSEAFPGAGEESLPGGPGVLLGGVDTPDSCQDSAEGQRDPEAVWACWRRCYPERGSMCVVVRRSGTAKGRRVSYSAGFFAHLCLLLPLCSAPRGPHVPMGPSVLLPLSSRTPPLCRFIAALLVRSTVYPLYSISCFFPC